MLTHMNHQLSDFRDFELPKLYKHAGRFVILGLVMLHWSQSMHFMAGNQVRLLSLAGGFSLIIFAGFLRASVIFEVFGSSRMIEYACAYQKPSWVCRDSLVGELVRELKLGLTTAPQDKHAFAQSMRAIIGNEYGFDVSATERYGEIGKIH